ncbi:PLP-dependent transferase [Streptomyces antimycoticus]|uniref:PLP-dependent transferase n=1 Tax=Streptomyces antimycoticus TaxID=68175 RepID=UPI0036E1E247
MAQVHHPGLPGDPGHMMAARQMNGFGAVLSFEFADADAAVADAACDAVRVIALDTGLGGVESTIERGTEHPGQEHVPPGLLRLSVGCEHIEDLWQDLLRASWSPVRDVWWPRPPRRVRGDERGAHFTERQPVVRAAFDELERRWAAELPQIRKEALRRRRDHGDAAMAETLAAFTDACARQAAQAATSLIAEFGG